MTIKYARGTNVFRFFHGLWPVLYILFLLFQKNMVEDTSTSIKAQTGEIKSSLVCKDIQLIESKKTLHANGKIKTIPDAVTW